MEPATAQATRRPAWLVGLAPLAVLAVAIGLFVLLDAPGLDRIGVPQEKLAVERTVLKPDEIQLHVRNDGADPVKVRQVIVNDAFAAFTQSDDDIGRLGGSEIDVDYPWIEGENYDVTLLTDTGATIDHTIEAAVETPDAGLDFYGLMALIGVYVGVIPVAIGMLWLPWLRGVDRRWIGFLLAFTVGLLGFLGVEALLEGTEIAGTGAESFGGAALVWLGAAGAFLALAGVDAWLRGRRSGGDGDGGAGRAAAIGLPRRVPRGARDRPAQPGGGPGDRLGLRRRVAGARRHAGGRLRASQHHRGARDRRAGGAGAAGERPPACAARAARGRARGARRVDRRVGLQPEPRRADVRRRGGSDRAGGRPDRACHPRRQRPPAASARGGRASHRPRGDVRDRTDGVALMAATRAETSEISNAVQDYAKAIWSIGQRTDAPVSTSAIAERLDVSPASASAMVKRLESLGLVSREPYHGVQLTRAGERVALEVLRHHRLLELYLAEALGMPWDRVHEEAEKLEHAISPELSELIAAKLGNPTHDPHGDPIPTRDGEIDEAPTRSLADLRPGERGVFSRVSDSNPEMLRYLSERGIAPGDELELAGREPFGGPLTVRANGREHALGDQLARAMRVERAQ